MSNAVKERVKNFDGDIDKLVDNIYYNDNPLTNLLDSGLFDTFMFFEVYGYSIVEFMNKKCDPNTLRVEFDEFVKCNLADVDANRTVREELDEVYGEGSTIIVKVKNISKVFDFAKIVDCTGNVYKLDDEYYITIDLDEFPALKYVSIYILLCEYNYKLEIIKPAKVSYILEHSAYISTLDDIRKIDNGND